MHFAKADFSPKRRWTVILDTSVDVRNCGPLFSRRARRLFVGRSVSNSPDLNYDRRRFCINQPRPRQFERTGKLSLVALQALPRAWLLAEVKS